MGSPIHSAFVQTPIGVLCIDAVEQGITSVRFVERARLGVDPFEHARKAAGQLREYFEGRREFFEDLPLIKTGTAFSWGVWSEIAKVPYASRRTYGELANALGRSGSAHAVGGAVGRNPFAIVIPCHRIVHTGVSADLGGYAWGMQRKKWLLDMEFQNK